MSFGASHVLYSQFNLSAKLTLPIKFPTLTAAKRREAATITYRKYTNKNIAFSLLETVKDSLPTPFLRR